jgi:hypothetical protein
VGSPLISEADFGRFVETATGSLFEVVSKSTIARPQQFLDEDLDLATIYTVAQEQGQRVRELRRTLPGN